MRAALWAIPVGLVAACGAAAQQPASPGRLPRAEVHFEQNATDADVEVVFSVKSTSEGLARLVVTAPDGRIAIDFSAPDASTLGIRQLDFESPEPPDVEGLKAAYPEGTYTFAARTASGRELVGTATLSHALPPAAGFVSPAPEATGVATSGLAITWVPVEGVAAYTVEIENDDLDMTLEAKLPASTQRFSVPEGLLAAGTEYELGIGTVTREGNVSIVETSFTTAE